MHPIQFAGQTDVGQRRNDNQDTFISTTIWSESNALLAVIDGVGGYSGGDRAAAIARESIEKYMTTPNGDPLSMLREAVVFANNQINDQRQQDLRLAQMCCVLTATVADANAGKLYFVHVGDTRLYRFRQNVLEKLTLDHSLVGIREDANELTEAEAMQHPRRNEILREVGLAPHRVDDPEFLDWGETDFLPGDQLLLCSDGLTDMITQAQITTILQQSRSLEEQTFELIRLANEQGGNDNITVVLAKNNKAPSVATSAVSAAESTQTRKQQTVPLSTNGSTATASTTKPAKRSNTGLWMLGLIVFVGLLAFAWYTFQQPDQPDPALGGSRAASTSDSTAASMAVSSSPLDSLLRAARRSATHQMTLPNDTFRLDKPLLLSDSLQAIIGANQLTVLIPADSTQSQVALRVIQRKNVSLQNLVIQGFKTGIETTGEVRLQLNQVYFRNVDRPVSAAVRQDTFRNTVVSISAQNQPVPPKTSRP